MPRLRLALVAALAAPCPGLAGPEVVTDIAPIHSIAAAVMAGVGEPDLIVQPGVSEHDYALRPSEAAALASADLVVWVGPALTSWLEAPIAALAQRARALALTDAEGVRLLPVRAHGPFEPADHDHPAPRGAAPAGPGAEHRGAADHTGGAAHADRDAAADHADAGVRAGHVPSGHGAGTRDAPAGGGHPASSAAIDPHIWLDPANGAAIASAIASALSAVDAANAAAYAANAQAFTADMAALEAEISADLAPVAGRPYMVFHDAFQYFEAAFGVPARGSVALNDAQAPRARRVAEIRERLARDPVDCVFAEPQFEPKLIAALIEETDARTGTLDPLGARLEQGAGLYPALLRRLANELAACLDAPS